MSHKCVGKTPGEGEEEFAPGTWGDPFYNEDPAITVPPNGMPVTKPPNEETACSRQVSNYLFLRS